MEQSVRLERSEAAGHLLAELDQVRDDLRHNRVTDEQARARIAVIRRRARSREAVSTHFQELDMQWNALIVVAEKLKEDCERHSQPDMVH